eukprot:245600_1
MEALVIFLSIATISTNTTSKLSYGVSTWSLPEIHHIQNNRFTNFAESPSFGLFHKKMNGKNMHPIFQNSRTIQIIKSHSLCIKLCPDERIIPIGNILRHLYPPECSSRRKRPLFQKTSSEIMGIIYWTHLICQMYKETTNNQFLI